MNRIELKVLAGFKDLLSSRLEKYSLLLFGSRARGDNDRFSDMDIIVILDEYPFQSVDEFVGRCAWEAGYEHGLVLVPLVFTKKEWESSIMRCSMLYRAVAMDGVAV